MVCTMCTITPWCRVPLCGLGGNRAGDSSPLPSHHFTIHSTAPPPYTTSTMHQHHVSSLSLPVFNHSHPHSPLSPSPSVFSPPFSPWLRIELPSPRSPILGRGATFRGAPKYPRYRDPRYRAGPSLTVWTISDQIFPFLSFWH